SILLPQFLERRTFAAAGAEDLIPQRQEKPLGRQLQIDPRRFRHRALSGESESLRILHDQPRLGSCAPQPFRDRPALGPKDLGDLAGEIAQKVTQNQNASRSRGLFTRTGITAAQRQFILYLNRMPRLDETQPQFRRVVIEQAELLHRSPTGAPTL